MLRCPTCAVSPFEGAKASQVQKLKDLSEQKFGLQVLIFQGAQFLNLGFQFKEGFRRVSGGFQEGFGSVFRF